MKNVLIISSTPRKCGNSELLCKEFERGAKEEKNKVDFISLRDKKVNYCVGCNACSTLGMCFQKDDMNNLASLAEKADVIVFATPVYFYSMSGQLKVFIDRLVQNYTKIRADIYIFITAWDIDTRKLENTVEAIRGCTRDCFSNCKEKGIIIAGGVTNKGDILGKDQMERAYTMGKYC